MFTGIITDIGEIVAVEDHGSAKRVAIACAYQVEDSDEALAPALELVAAYHAVSPLEPRERAILFDLIATRMVMTIVISNIRAARYPQNSAYILRNNKQASARLARIAKLSREDAQAMIERACQGE